MTLCEARHKIFVHVQKGLMTEREAFIEMLYAAHQSDLENCEGCAYCGLGQK